MIRGFVACVCVFVFICGASAATLYKCVSDGRVAYQETPCADAKAEQKQLRSEAQSNVVWVRDKDVTSKMLSACVSSLNNWVSFKDPESVKILNDKSKLIASEVWMRSRDFSGRALRMFLQVNAKNSYGGYTGENPFSCYTSLDGEVVRGISDVLLE